MASVITIRDSVCYLSIDNPLIMEAIVNNCSFQLEGVEYMGRWRGGDRRTKLVKNHKAPVGLLDRICRIIVANGDVPRVSYSNTQITNKPKIVMQLYGVEPRDYQIEAQIAADLNNGGVFRAPTGSGKTCCIAILIIAKSTHALVIVPTKDLLHQTRQYLADHLSGDIRPRQWKIGQLGDGVVDPQPVTVATIRTISNVLGIVYQPYQYAECDDSDDTKVDPKQLRSWVESIGTIIVDESHCLGAKTVFDVTTKIPALYKYGMSASPWRDDGADLMIEAATGPVIYHISTKRLVEAGYLMAPEFIVKDTSSWWTSAAWGNVCTSCGRQWLKWTRVCNCGNRNFRSQWQEAYKQEIVENQIRNTRIAEIVQELDRPTLVLVKQVKHGRLLQELIPESIFLSGKDKGIDRQIVFDRVRSGEQKAIICTTIGDQGLDLPNLQALVLAGGGASSTRHLQRVGRVVRPSLNKQQPVVIDFQDGHINAWFSKHEKARRKVERSEWQDSGAVWINE